MFKIFLTLLILLGEVSLPWFIPCHLNCHPYISLTIYAGNRLTSIAGSQFPSMPNLYTADLSRNQLTDVPTELWNQMTGLEVGAKYMFVLVYLMKMQKFSTTNHFYGYISVSWYIYKKNPFIFTYITHKGLCIQLHAQLFWIWIFK